MCAGLGHSPIEDYPPTRYALNGADATNQQFKLIHAQILKYVGRFRSN
jgi:hypothetical protein